MTLVAHSYGSLLAASYAIAHPANVRRMVFFGPVPPRRATNPSSTEVEIRQACREQWAIGLRPRLADPDHTIGLVKSDLCATDPNGIRYGSRIGNRVIMNSYGDWDLRPQLRSLTVPLLVVDGEEESIPMDLVEEWVTSMPNARLLKVPRGAHFTYAERPELVWPAVEKFLGNSGK